MSKLEDIKIRTDDRALKELLSEIVAFWNLGKIGFTIISAEPTDNPEDAELRLFDNGSVARLYVYGPVSAKWYKTDNLTSV